MFDQFNAYRNKKGYLILDTLHLFEIPRRTHGSRTNKTWFRLEDGCYLFKANLGELEEIKEVINEEIARQSGFKNAQYDVAIYQGKKGVITKDFTLGTTFTPMIKILCECNQLHNNLCTFYNAFVHRKLTASKIDINMHYFLRGHILDIFTCQHDRNFKNIGVLGEADQLTVAPRYDSAGSFLTIAKKNKINSFMASSCKEALIPRYNGIRTKLRILPGKIEENAIDEFLEARYTPSTFVPKAIEQNLANIDPFITQVENTNFPAIFSLLEDYHIQLPYLYRDFFQTVFDLKVNEYEKKKQYKKQCL